MATVISRGVCVCVCERETERERNQMKLCPSWVLYKPITKWVTQLWNVSLWKWANKRINLLWLFVTITHLSHSHARWLLTYHFSCFNQLTTQQSGHQPTHLHLCQDVHVCARVCMCVCVCLCAYVLLPTQWMLAPPYWGWVIHGKKQWQHH